jgi:hypothetical protein
LILSQTSAGKGLVYLISRSLFGAGGFCDLRIDGGDRPRFEVSTTRQNAPSDAGAAGELTPDEAGSVIALIDAKRRILADVDLEARVTALEASAKAEGGS